MASLQSFKVEASATQKGVSTAKLGETGYKVSGVLSASLPEGLSAKLNVTDKTLQSVRAAAARARDAAARPRRGRAAADASPMPHPQLAGKDPTRPEGASLEIKKGGAWRARGARRGARARAGARGHMRAPGFCPSCKTRSLTRPPAPPRVSPARRQPDAQLQPGEPPGERQGEPHAGGVRPRHRPGGLVEAGGAPRGAISPPPRARAAHGGRGRGARAARPRGCPRASRAA